MSASPTDLMDLEGLFSAEELAVRDRVAAFVDRRVRPNIARWYEDAVLPVELLSEMADLGLFGMHLQGYGCAGRSAVEYGLAMQEMEAGDSGLRTVVSVQGSLAMSAISKHGSEEQKQKWLPRMARGEAIGAFGLTEPTAGSDPGAMRTRARCENGEWVLDGAKRWIGLASIAQVVVVWAKASVEDVRAAGVLDEARLREGATDQVRAFLVPTDAPGFSAEPITGKLSMRASLQCDIEMEGVRLPQDAVLPGAQGLGGAFACLNEARYGIAWGAMGAARDALEAALDYAGQRIQFGQPLSARQITQEKLATMAVSLNQGQLLALRLGRAKDAGTLEPHMISVAKLNNCRTAIEICRTARTVLGGNGITTDYSPLRHANNLESVRTYEGTDEVHTLVIGQKLTGIPAFR